MDFLAFFSVRKMAFSLNFVNERLGAAIVLVIGLFGFGYYSHYQAFGQELDGQDQAIGLGIHGHVLIKAYHSDGTIFRIWEGDNSVSPIVINAFVSCATGLSTQPSGFGQCHGLMTAIEISEKIQQANNSQTVFSAISTATNELMPQGCDPNSPSPTSHCTSWTSTARFEEQITQETRINHLRGVHEPTLTTINSVDLEIPTVLRPGDIFEVVWEIVVQSQ